MEISIPANKFTLKGELNIPIEAKGIIIFAHGSGSGRFSPRNQFVADALRESGFATLLFDLLTPEEEVIDAVHRHLRFNITFLANRLAIAASWVTNDYRTRELVIGLFGASTGAAAALVGAVKFDDKVFAVVSRGGRPDLAANWLKSVHAPTLFIVGGNDHQVLKLNESAARQLRNTFTRIEVIPQATHLFEEPGAMEQVSTLTCEWFSAHYLNRRRQIVDVQKKQENLAADA